MTTSALVPSVLPFAIDGHPYLIDPNYQRETVQVIRQQSDTSTEPGEQSLTPLGLWRRSQESWHHGAGQDFLDGRDEKAADPHRFRASKGIDPWTRGEISLLNKTLKVWSSAATNLALATAVDATTSRNYLILADGTEVYSTAEPTGLLSYNTAEFETDVSGWVAGANTTIARSTAWSRRGVASLELTPVAAGTISANTPTGTSGIPIDPGRNYQLSGYFRAAISARVWSAFIDWYDAAGAFISTDSFTPGTSDATGSDSTFTMQDSPPANGAYASLRFSFAATSGAADIHRADTFTFAPSLNVAGLPGWMSVDINAGDAAQTVQSIATDGTYIWAALGTSGLHRTTAGATTSTADVPAAPASGQISLVGYANGFLLAAGSAGVSATRKNSLWRVDDPLGVSGGPTLSLIKTHPNPSFVWTGIASGRSAVYAFGNSGVNGEVYKITFDPNTGTLSTAASPATALPDGEQIHSLVFYAGGIIMGTGRGVRLGQADGAGNIDYGPLIEMDYPVRCLEPQSRWCWFGWSNHDTTSTGLGRIDLGFYTDTLTPAYASDLMGTAQGEVLSAVTFLPYTLTKITNSGEARVFAVSGVGVFYEDVGSLGYLGTLDRYKVASATLETGAIRFSTSEPKTTRSLDVRHHALAAGGSVAAELQRDSSGTWTSVGSSSTANSYGPATPLDLQDLNAEAMEFRLTLARATDPQTGAEVTRWTAKVLPLPSTIDETFTVTVHMRSTVETTAGDGQPYRIDVPTEVAFLKTLERARTIVDMQLGDTTHEVYVLSSKFLGDHWTSPKREYSEGMLELTVQTARG